jgi:hypothetical protein
MNARPTCNPPRQPGQAEYRVVFTAWRNRTGDVLGTINRIETASYTLYGCKLKRGSQGTLWVEMPPTVIMNADGSVRLVDGKPQVRTTLVLRGNVRERFQRGVLAEILKQHPGLGDER